MRAFIAPVGTLHSTVPAELQTPLISEARPTRKTREKKTRVFWKNRAKIHPTRNQNSSFEQKLEFSGCKTRQP